jgi:hypothetical protein
METRTNYFGGFISFQNQAILNVLIDLFIVYLFTIGIGAS